MGFWARIKRKINRFLENVAKENQKSFGNQKLDCCDLNRNADGKVK